MSPWLNSPLVIGVGTRELVVAATAPRWKVVRGHAAALAEPTSVAIPDEQCFTENGVLDALKMALAADHGQTVRTLLGKRQVRIMLDDFWASHAILRGDFRTVRASEIDQILLAHFFDRYGIEAESVQVRFSVQRGGRAVFASAIARTLHDGIREAGMAAGVDVRSLRLCLPDLLNRVQDAAAGASTALLLFVADTLMQAVLFEENRWVAYDSQRLFPGDASDAERIAAQAEQSFECLAGRTSGKCEDCRIYLCGAELDPAPFEGRFCSTQSLAQPAMDKPVAHRLMEAAR
ncbi:hypothetical protein F6X42_19555 [Paraburkholderia sp. WC7.3b]|uniref:Uncharacterized protein n=2 Tax=Paraburkholderia TaxID=1822464 RepID=A0ABR7PQZ9_9BURK|nr:hypothetical protein [Paraburkholderia podalyriae]